MGILPEQRLLVKAIAMFLAETMKDEFLNAYALHLVEHSEIRLICYNQSTCDFVHRGTSTQLDTISYSV